MSSFAFRWGTLGSTPRFTSRHTVSTDTWRTAAALQRGGDNRFRLSQSMEIRPKATVDAPLHRLLNPLINVVRP
jgi:hypothetical protein